jgi:murein L,D-transpeptidase YafK
MGKRHLSILTLCILFIVGVYFYQMYFPGAARPGDLMEARQATAAAVQAAEFTPGSPVYIRIFKHEKILEVWMKQQKTYTLFKTYPICVYSGDLGPKLKEGDGQSPEGFYRVYSSQLKPDSRFHLAFNIGFPNAYDQAQGRTGSFLMVHGACVSIGCYAMTDAGIEEIYAMVEAALNHKQPFVPVHIFPFKMTPQAMNQHQQHRWISFWQMLQPAYAAFEQNLVPPTIDVTNGFYKISSLP